LSQDILRSNNPPLVDNVAAVERDDATTAAALLVFMVNEREAGMMWLIEAMKPDSTTESVSKKSTCIDNNNTHSIHHIRAHVNLYTNNIRHI
jgi:hypothetical protein